MTTLDKAASLLEKKFYIQAIQLLSDYLEDHESWIGYYQLGLAYLARFDYENSRDSFKKSVELNETSHNQLQFGYVELMLGNGISAVKALKKSVQLSPVSEAYMLLGSSLTQIGDYDSAIDALKKSINLNANWNNFNSLGDAYSGLN